MNKPFGLTEQEKHGIERWLYLTDSQKRRPFCPHCGSTDTRECGFQPITRGGGMLTLIEYRCAECHKFFWI